MCKPSSLLLLLSAVSSFCSQRHGNHSLWISKPQQQQPQMQRDSYLSFSVRGHLQGSAAVLLRDWVHEPEPLLAAGVTFPKYVPNNQSLCWNSSLYETKATPHLPQPHLQDSPDSFKKTKKQTPPTPKQTTTLLGFPICEAHPNPLLRESAQAPTAHVDIQSHHPLPFQSPRLRSYSVEPVPGHTTQILSQIISQGHSQFSLKEASTSL